MISYASVTKAIENLCKSDSHVFFIISSEKDKCLIDASAVQILHTLCRHIITHHYTITRGCHLGLPQLLNSQLPTILCDDSAADRLADLYLP